MNMTTYMRVQADFSTKTFGPYGEARSQGILDHARKEIEEIVADPMDVEEWCDLAILAFDGALSAVMQNGMVSEGDHVLAASLVNGQMLIKQRKNFARQWPARADQVAGKAVEHIRTGE